MRNLGAVPHPVDRNNRAGLSLVGFVLFLYAVGILESVWHLPVPNHRRRRFLSALSSGGASGGGAGRVQQPQLGGNINVAKSGLEEGQDDTVGEDLDDPEADQDDKWQEEAGGAGGEGEGNAPAGVAGKGAGWQQSQQRLQPGSAIPEARWPVSIRDEDGRFEDVIHPGHRALGHPDVVMSVPRFWVDDPVSVHQNRQMSRETAMRIGSCVTPDGFGNHARGDKCPVSERTVFVAIASYRDWQCRDTVTSIFSRAKHPERVRVGVVDQIVVGEDGSCDAPYEPCGEKPDQEICKYRSQLDVFQVDAPLSIGPVFARHLGHRMYRGEYYYMQSDAHVTFVQDWDEDIISQQEATRNEMAVLTTYLTDIVGSIDKEGRSLRETRPIMCNTDYESGQNNRYLRHGSQPEGWPVIRGTPQLEPYWAAGFSFSRGHFVVTTPYDFYQPMIFQGEEMSIGIRGWTIGYDYYAFERSICFHHYAEGVNARKRNKVKHFWENSNQFSGSGVKAMFRLLGIVHMNPEISPERWDHTEEKRYGLGGVRTPELFYQIFGIDVVRKQTEHHLCKFVEGGKMHKDFTSHLRPDGMGIDYSQISYRFKDPQKPRNRKGM